MTSIMKYITVVIMVSFALNLNAQDEKKDSEETRQSAKIERLKKEKEIIVAQEKRALKKAVIDIDKRLERNEISKEEAQKLKEEAAKKHALNIDNKIAIVDYKIALIERNGKLEDDAFDGTALQVGLGNPNEEEGNRVFGISFKNTDKPIKYDKRTTSDLILAVGFNNAIQDGVSFNDSDYRVAGSRFFEIGWQWKTRVFKESNFLRFNYGISLQSNNLKPTGNRIFVDEDGQTTLEDFEFNLNKSKLRLTNLVVPVHFEFGPSKKREKENYIRYSTYRKFKVGLGGYAGINIGTVQKLRFRNDGQRFREKIRGDFNVNDFIYGVSGYVGWGGTSLYLKYDLNPIFNDDQPEQRNISLGLRFDFY